MSGGKYKRKNKRGQLVLKKPKPLRNPATAQRMEAYRARGVESPGNRRRRDEEHMRTPWSEYERTRIINEEI